MPANPLWPPPGTPTADAPVARTTSTARGRARLDRGTRRAAAVVLFLALVPISQAGARPLPQPGGVEATVVGDEELNVRAGPGLTQPVLRTLRPGDRVTIVGGPLAGDGWTWCEHTGSGGQGWSVCVALATARELAAAGPAPAASVPERPPAPAEQPAAAAPTPTRAPPPPPPQTPVRLPPPEGTEDDAPAPVVVLPTPTPPARVPAAASTATPTIGALPAGARLTPTPLTRLPTPPPGLRPAPPSGPGASPQGTGSTPTRSIPLGAPTPGAGGVPVAPRP
jgi:hypothetical protein